MTNKKSPECWKERQQACCQVLVNQLRHRLLPGGLMLLVILLLQPAIAPAIAPVIAPVIAKASPDELLTHVVVCWLHDDVTETQLQQVIEKTRQLKTIPGLLDLHVGQAIASERPIVDDSFSFAVSMQFASVEAMQAYLGHPQHVEFVNNELKPLLKKIVVYDF